MRISRLKSEEDRRRFADARKLGKHKIDVMSEIGISEATYYSWSAKFNEKGEAWIKGERLTRAIRLPATTARTSRREIVELSLRYPNYGKIRLTRMLKQARGYNGSPATVHSILSKNKLATSKDRIEELHRRFLNGLALSEEQRRAVETLDPLVRQKATKGQGLGDVLTQDVRRFSATSPFGTAQISIVIDTFSEIAFACFKEPTSDDLTSQCLQMVIDELQRSDITIKTMWIDAGHEFGYGHPAHPYTKLLQAHKITRRRIDASTSNRPNPHMIEVWKELRKFLCNGGISEPERFRECLWELNPMIREFLDDKWNRCI